MRTHFAILLAVLFSAGYVFAEGEDAPVPERTRAPEASAVEVKKPTQDEILAEARRIEYEKKLSKLPRKGTLSSSVVGGTTSAELSLPWGEGENADESGTPPISGSVSKNGKNESVARIFNNTEDRFSASFEVVQLDIRGKRLKADRFSISIGPKETVERRIKTLPATDRSDLNMTGWKNLSRKVGE